MPEHADFVNMIFLFAENKFSMTFRICLSDFQVSAPAQRTRVSAEISVVENSTHSQTQDCKQLQQISLSRFVRVDEREYNPDL